jgi:parallel beta-helix repeat protein
MKNLLNITALVLLFTTMSLAATYYVDNQGNDNNNGTSPSSPWKTIAKVNSTTFSSGDQILFKKGGTWYETIQVKNNNILYGAYGSGSLPVIDGQLTRSNNIYISGRSGVTIQNFELRNNGGSGSIRVQNSSKIIVENNVLYATAKGIFFETSTQCTVRNNNITTPTFIDKQTDGIYSQRNNGNVYENNYIVIRNTAETQHNDGIQCFEDTDITARGNYIEQDNFKTGNSQGIYATNNSGRHVWYNNIINTPNIKANSLGFLNLTTAYTGTVEVYHNTVIQKGGNALVVQNAPNFIAKNNIFMTNGTTYVITVKGSVSNWSNLNYNVYYNSGSTQAAAYLESYGGLHSMSQLRSRGAEAKGLYGNPLLDAQWMPKDGSLVVDKGLNLSAPYNIDKNGTSRPFNTASDMGAIERKWTISAVPATPSSLNSNVISQNRVDLTWTDGCNTEEGFKIERRTPSGSWVQLQAVGINVTTYQDNNLTPATSYEYRVRAYNSTGNSGYSNISSALTHPAGDIEDINIAAMYGTLYGASLAAQYGSIASEVVTMDNRLSYANYSFTIVAESEYYLQGRFFHGSPGKMPFEVQFNGGTKTTFSYNSIVGNWRWANKVSLGVLQPGTYTFTITNLKPSSDSYIDMLLVTTDPHFAAVKDQEGIDGADFGEISNYPNPFNPQTTIIYNLAAEGDISLKVYDILGNEVDKLAEGFQKAGTHKYVFNGNKFASGIYIIELRTSEKVFVRKMNLLK